MNPQIGEIVIFFIRMIVNIAIRFKIIEYIRTLYFKKFTNIAKGSVWCAY